MLKRFLPVAGAFALTLALLAGCQDTPSTGPQSAGTSSVIVSEDPYTAYFVPDGALTDAADLPSFDQVMNDPSFLPPIPGDPGRGGPGDDTTHRGGKDTTRRDTTRGGKDTVNHGGPGGPDDRGHGKRPEDSVRHDGRDTTHRDTTRGGKDTNDRRPPKDSLRLKPINYNQIIGQLRLTPAQDSAIRLCFRDLNECTRSAATRYRTALQGLRDDLQAALTRIRAAVDGGTMTRAEAKVLIDRLVAQYRTNAGALEAAYRQAVETCRHEFERCVASHLTPEQLRRWEAAIRR